MKARATRIALIVASVPELTKRTSSRLGIASRMRSRELELERARRAEARPLAQRLLERGHDSRMRVAEDQRPPREDVVDVAVPVDVDEVRALAAVDEERRAADRLERAHGRADAARQQVERLGEEPFGGLARHARAPASARATDSAASSPERMQSGIPTPRYAAPAQREPRVLRQGGVDPRETLRMTEEVLRHPPGPAVHAREHRLRGDADEPDLCTSQCDQIVVGVLGQIASAEPSGVDTDQHRVVGSATVPLLRRPRAREHVRAVDARDEVAIAVERSHVRAREGERDDDGRRVRDLGVCRGELGVEIREQLGRHERGRRDDDAVRLDHLSVDELEPVALRRTRHARSAPAEQQLGALERIHDSGHERAHPVAKRHERRQLARRRRRQAAQDAAVLELEHPQLRERRAEREPIAVAAVDPGHQRLDERLVRLASEAAGDERPDRLVLVAGSRRDIRLGGEAQLALGRQELAALERLEVRGDHPGQTLGERVQVVATANERVVVLGPPRDELIGEAELVDEPDAALLPRQEAVRRGLDHESVDALGAQLAAEHAVALDQHDLRRRRDELETACRREPRDPAADDDDLHAGTSTFARTSSASVAMNTGSSFSAGGRSRRMPRPSAT